MRDNDEEYYQSTPGGSSGTPGRLTGISPAGAVTGGAQVIFDLQLNSASFGAFVVLCSLLDAFICFYWRLATYLLFIYLVV